MLSRLIDGQLPPDLVEDVESHVAYCPSCAAFAKELAALDNALENLPVHEFPLTLQVTLRNLERQRAFSWRGDLARAAACIATGGAVIVAGETFPGSVELLTNAVLTVGSFVLLFSRTFRPATPGSG
jgi:anti-sigma factor RsiW